MQMMRDLMGRMGTEVVTDEALFLEAEEGTEDSTATAEILTMGGLTTSTKRMDSRPMLSCWVGVE